MPRRVAERTEAVERQPEQPLAQEDHLLGLREHAELRIEADLERRTRAARESPNAWKVAICVSA